MASFSESPIPNPESRRFVLVAGETSGDLLGADLIRALRERFPDAAFAGIGGPQMIAAGFETWHPMEKLSVMGLVEVLSHLPGLLSIRRDLVRRTIAFAPDAFIGIDAPDFNLGVERRLKRAGVRTVHYVSPSVWAWREKRAAKIGRSADLVLCLFPMEPPIYARHGVDAAKAAMFEDLARNLEVPHALGMTTVLVVPQGERVVLREAWELAGHDDPHIDHRTDDLTAFLERIAGARAT